MRKSTGFLGAVGLSLPVLMLLSSVSAWSGPVEKIVVFSGSSHLNRAASVITRGGGEITRELNLINAVVASFPSEESASQSLNRMPGVVLVENDEYLYWLLGEEIPSGIPSLENFMRAAAQAPVPAARPAEQPVSTQKLPWGMKRMGASAAWQKVTGRGVKVCVLDTGIDTDHPDLAANYADGYNFVNPGAAPEDDTGHGTHVSGIIAAAHNSFGVIGMAPGASLYVGKTMDAKGGGKISWLIDGLGWCRDKGARIVNMSLGSPKPSEAAYKAIKAVYAEGVTIIAASGNDPKASVSYPAAYPEVIAVSALTPETWSVSGILTPEGVDPLASTGPEVDIIAPGQIIYSTALEGSYNTMNGTSMAAPHVAGAAALAMSFGYVTPAEIRGALERAAVKLPGLTSDQQGFGLINVGNIPAKQ
ncbi:MAG: hypothetical protein A2X28_02890 [Elusimicrobia bacterium GWA2_56_46]|nr:MAG: hypothetical protein A2X28_02890 [Elusimicrobia bacterium GWA2_56_46]OGR54175.1 MAG: hypothetical protein A2X39_08835 [Elusimicrobia bacterium GWC2_56_31]HBB68243.1 hypothetical protein [Elusimicrobiota bacterium]HBW21752.1 hypothetical protein [Elusimicrobiota bacterium]